MPHVRTGAGGCRERSATRSGPTCPPRFRPNIVTTAPLASGRTTPSPVPGWPSRSRDEEDAAVAAPAVALVVASGRPARELALAHVPRRRDASRALVGVEHLGARAALGLPGLGPDRARGAGDR